MANRIIKVALCFCFLGSYYSLSAQEYPVSKIPEELKKGASAVVRYEENNFIQTDMNNASEKVTKIITVLKDTGEDFATLVIPLGRFFELRSFSGEILLESGKVFKKIGKSDLTTTAYSTNLATDDYYSYYDPSAPSYPYTVKYTYEVKWRNGLAYYPTFAPVPGFECAVERSVLKIRIPAGISARFKANTHGLTPIREAIDKDSIYTFTSENFPAIAYEPLAPSFSVLSPVTYAAPNDFIYDKISGNMSSWRETGLFLTKLQEQRTTLPPETVTKLKEMTASAKSEREKVEIVYGYLQKTTRYVSIQLGIGGWQPISAEQVDKVRYGDCKGLTNYMKAMLAAIGIDSEYAVINLDKKRMFADFSSLSQANHVVLMVTIPNDTIWLECTSQDLPSGYIHSQMSGHDVLFVKGEQSRLYTAPELPGAMHTKINMASVKLSPDATVISKIRNEYTNHEVEDVLRFILYKSEKERINDLATSLSVNKAQIGNIKTDYRRTENPSATISYDMKAEKYATTTGDRMFVMLNPFRNQWGRTFSSSSRKHPIHITSTINQTDSIEFELPPDYTIEAAPNSESFESDFGKFSSTIEISGNNLKLVQTINIPPGEYSAESYPQMREFFRKVDNLLSSRIVLRKEE